MIRGLTTFIVLLALLVASSVSAEPVKPATHAPYRQTGEASWYGSELQGRRTATGEHYDMNRLTAAHRTLPLGSEVMVTNLANGRSIRVRINDRGPFRGGYVIDLSAKAAEQIGMKRAGKAHVRVEALAAGRTAS
jgi:rare lipoprotein A